MKKAIVIFGSTGNLMYKKLLPALYQLLTHQHIQDDVDILCVGRRDYTTKEYIQDAQTQVPKEILDKLKHHIHYLKLDVDDEHTYQTLTDTIQQKQPSEVVYYLATPPSLFPVIAKGLSTSGLVQKKDNHSRIVFEKPFGESLESARAINQDLWQYFDESQIYRIDHYLGKEMIQNILIVRFSNLLFRQSWDHQSIERVFLLAKESEGVLTRGNYYDSIGAIKDMLQSHMLQMLALIAMEQPLSYDSEAIKNAKISLLKDVKIAPKDIIFGQYNGYKDTINIDRNSTTETFVFAEASIQNERWKGVPFYLMTGKQLNEKRSEIIIDFKSIPSDVDLFKHQSKNKNQLRIKVAPDEGVVFEFNVKEPGLSQQIVPATLDYCHSCQTIGNTPEAYERLLLDVLSSSRTLFTRWDEIETTWSIVEKMKQRNKHLFIYNNYEDILEEIKHQFGEEFYDL